MKRRTWLLLVLGVALLACVIMYVSASRQTYAVRYEVIGGSVATQAFQIAYTTESGGTAQRTDVSLPWVYGFRAQNGAMLSLLAQNAVAAGTITCRISIDGKVVKETTSEGGYVVATCNTIIGLE